MVEYISRREANEWVADWLREDRNWHPYSKGKNIPTIEVFDILARIPAADVRPVVRGHWIGTKEAEDMGDIMKEFTCSVCGCCERDCTESESFNFCPNCGADMRGE